MMKDDRYRLTKDDFYSLSSEISDMTPKVVRLVEITKKIIAFVGATGSGKSTIISLLQGAPLSFAKLGGGRWKIDHNDTSGKYPKIGHQKESCTTLPDVYEANKKAYIDLAGWFDTRTPKQQIINGLSNSMVFTPGKQLKIVIVVEASELQVQRGGVLVQIADRLIEFYEDDFLTIVNSIVLVITKANSEEWKIIDIKNEIKQICRLNQNLKQNTRHLLTTLVEKQRIAIFPKPQKPEQLEQYVEEIKRQIYQIRGATLSHGGCVTLSQKAVNVVNDCLQYLNNDLNVMAKNLGQQLQKQLSKRQFQNGKQANDLLNQLNVAKQILDKELSQCANLKKYEELLDELVQKLPIKKSVTDDIKRNFNMINFYLKINRKARIQPGFMQVIKSALQNNILKIQAIRDKIVSSQEKKQMEAKFKKDMEQRQKRNKQELNEFRQQMRIQKQQMEKKLDEDRKIYELDMKNQKQLKQKLQKQIQQVKRQNLNRPVIQQKQEEGGFVSFFKGFGQVLKTTLDVITHPVIGMFQSKKSKYDQDDQ